jgi:hypothetical protein
MFEIIFEGLKMLSRQFALLFKSRVDYDTH